jgi:HAD superfamily hydrolase (TIGR01509 family)
MSRNAKAGVTRAILWDLDGVLVRTEDLYFRATQEVLYDLDEKLSRYDFHRLFMRQFHDPLRLSAEARGLGESGFLNLHRKRSRIYLDLLASEEITIEGASETIHRLAKSYSMGVVTGSKKEHVEVLATRTDFFHIFNFVITLEDVPTTKPYPEPYLKGVERTGFDARACLAIEDSERGLRSAKSAGIECWVIPNALTHEADFILADRILGDIREVSEILCAPIA